MSARFAHLHVRSEYSLIDSTVRLKALAKQCAAQGQPAVAVTDVNNLFSLVKFYKAAEGAGVKPIAGADVLLAEGDEAPWQLTLLCRDHDGYLALSRLLTRAWMEGHRNDGVVLRPHWLVDHVDGLFALAGRNARSGQLLAEGREDLADAALADAQRWFGDRLHLELTRCGLPDEEDFNRFALEAAARRSVPVIASNDVRFLQAEGFDAHEARVCIGSGRVLDDPRRPHNYSAEQWLKPSHDMATLFADVPDAIDNTLELAKRCNLELRLGTYYLPAFPVPDDETLDSWIRSEAHRGLAKRLETAPLAQGMSREDYDARLNIELDVIIKMGFPGYFLIVADFINWGKANDIPVGPGRGSGAGSLVAWALGITDLDPLPYDLLFERFLNPERVSMPDFDIDFCMDRRDEVIDYVARKYGRDRVSQIITYGTMAAKAVVRDAGRVLGHGYGMVDSVAKLIPMTLGIGLDDALGRTEKSQKDDAWRSDELITRYEAEEDVRELLNLALQLEDLTRNAGKHAGGVVIAPNPLSDFCPLYAEDAGESDGRGKNPVTQFDKDDVEAVGLVKFDFLGLRTLTIIDWAVKAINANKPDSDKLDISRLELTDKASYELFARGETVAVFQFESRGMRELLKRAQPDTFEDIIALAALFRPGPLGSGMDKEWVDRKHGRTEVSYPHPLLEPVLAPTYGVIVYQEQVMQIAQVLAGYSLGGADLLRRAMGKKKPEEMAKQRAMFEAGAAERGVNPVTATSIFDLMEKFAEYGFNKSHSAAYALVAYQTAWLKVHYPAEFMAAVLSSDMDKTEKVVEFLNEVRRMQLEVLPPDVNESAFKFHAIGSAKQIRYGLGAIKGVGQNVCEAIAEERQRGGRYVDLLDFCRRVDSSKLNRRVLEALAQAGALDGLGSNRASLMAQVPEALRATEQLAREAASGQNSLFGGDTAAPSLHIELPQEPDWPLLRRLQGERDTLGLYLTGHPLDPYRPDLLELVGSNLGDIETIWENRPADARKGFRPAMNMILAGQITAVRKRGETQAFIQLDDGKGRIECALMGDEYTEYAPLLTRDAILVVEGRLREDPFSGGFSITANRCWNYDNIVRDHVPRMVIRADLRKVSTLRVLESVWDANRSGSAMVLETITPTATGCIEIPAQHGMRLSQELPSMVRDIPGIKTVKLVFQRPWGS